MKQCGINSRKEAAFTIVEVIIVTVVIGILIAVNIVAYGSWQKNTRTTQVKSELIAAGAAMEKAVNFESSYPVDATSVYTPKGDVVIRGGLQPGTTNTFCVHGYHISDPASLFSVGKGGTVSAGACLASVALPAPNETTFTTNGTFTKPAGAVSIDVIVVGRGGNGDLLGGTLCGGGGGGVRTARFAASTISTSVPITFNATTGDVSFGSYLTAGGGGNGATSCGAEGAPGGAGGGTSPVYGAGGVGGRGGLTDTDIKKANGGSGITGGGGAGAFWTFPAGAGGVGSIGGGGGGALSGFGGALGVGGALGGTPGTSGGGGTGGGFGGGGGGAGEEAYGAAGAGLGAPGVVKVSVSYE